ncbi:mannose-6-phosphate isomerase, class I [Rhizomonospora bruguierae]|uniref:mannose-6-phosphate isomerase, class I n=1 Tax=Rhizomonospora bruguierae TaxID=1581705 RepID=UPI001BCCD272|nr:mannose-6-phosphate isomerase, class I [Micromonospora sp. NBRC 107566]
MERLTNPIRGYAWGSRSVIAEVRGRPVPSEGPEAELWMGAHPDSPSTVERDGAPVSLAALIAADPKALLGAAVADRFGPRLPYLMKLLAADQPLSLQAHPDLARAAEAFAAGYPGYSDDQHKPELLVAVRDMDALCGFQDPGVSAALLASLNVPALAPVVAALRGGDPSAALRTAVESLLTWAPESRGEVVAAVGAACAARSPAAPGSYVDGYAVGRELAARYPGDMGVVVALLLNLVHLRPGDAVWMPAGNLHAYLTGAGVEIMAASDNVLRGGLTPKRVDVPELLRVLRFEVLREPVRRPVPVAPGVDTWPTPAAEFALYRVSLDGAGQDGAAARSDGVPAEVPVRGPVIAFCLRGEVRVDDGGAEATLRGGEAAFGTAVGAGLRCAGRGEVWVAAPAD